jgi:hypothetical protein
MQAPQFAGSLIRSLHVVLAHIIAGAAHVHALETQVSAAGHA